MQCDGNTPCASCQNDRISCQSPPALAYRCRLSSQQVPPISRAGRTDARYSSLLRIDDSVAPSLVAKTAAAQQTQLYINFVMSAFPCYFKATETRVPINWVEYVDARRGGVDSPFDWAIRSMTTMYTGSLHNDPRYLDASHELYIRALRGLSGLLGDVSTVKSDNALATAIALAVLEMHFCHTAEGWTHHASGIRALMRLRGPKAHLHGFGCALYIACRNTLVTSALVSGEECFLEEPEWQELNEQIAAENAKQPDSSVYTEITERAFREIVKLPGFVKRVREVLGATCDVRKSQRTTLLRQLLATQAALRGIHTEFSISVSSLRAGHEPRAGFIGPTPLHFFDGFSALSAQGIQSGILLLNYLLILIDPSQRSAAEAENSIISDRMRIAGGTKPLSTSLENKSLPTPPKSPRRDRLIVESMITPATCQPPTTDWMDRIATTMGMEGVRVRLADDHEVDWAT